MVDGEIDEDSLLLLGLHSLSSEEGLVKNVASEFEGLRLVYYVMLEYDAARTEPAENVAAAETAARAECAQLEAQAAQIARASLQVGADHACKLDFSQPEPSRCCTCWGFAEALGKNGAIACATRNYVVCPVLFQFPPTTI